MSIDKPFTTYEDQIEKLKSKDLVILDEEYAINLLKDVGYFSLISGYKKPFKMKDDKKKYIKGTKLEDIYALYTFDEELRFIMLKYILIVERKIKNLLAYSFVSEYGADQEAYLEKSNYDYRDKNIERIDKLYDILKNIVENPDEHNYIKHQYENHHNIPLWVTVKAMTFGNISRMYSLCMQKVQMAVSKEFPTLYPNDLISMLDVLSRFRNVCAHNERLYNFKLSKKAIPKKYIHQRLIKKDNKGRPVSGRQDLMAVLIILKYTLPQNSFESLVQELKMCMDNLHNATTRIQKDSLLKEMGFPQNWEEIVELPLTEPTTAPNKIIKKVTISD